MSGGSAFGPPPPVSARRAAIRNSGDVGDHPTERMRVWPDTAQAAASTFAGLSERPNAAAMPSSEISANTWKTPRYAAPAA